MDYLPYLFLLLPITAIIGMFAVRFTSEKDLFRISWDKISQFVGFLALIFTWRLLQANFLYTTGLMEQFPQNPVGMPFWTMGLVFWEDFFFAVPIYFICKHMTHKWLKFSLIFAISALFGLGHLYQGWEAVFILAFMPYFVTYRYGKQYGFGTTMICHILYDVSTVIFIKSLPYLI